ncbi:amidase [Bradyrhizobium sp. LHD-71]|uniref:amidase n=1 Tax=Bradyrhizobium sp. LHD-71 TaxID=3072141 RepID=UPI00280D18B9|nr:amidase [Bradyrhizobium sp. LHD-71]MDQ8727684.1 amidase [Bradyrhizobium sp. LHD-71]
MTKPLHDCSIAEAGALLRNGTITSTALTEHALDRIKTIDPLISSFITLTAEQALADAATADADFAKGVDRGPMQGIPHALKDIYATAGIRTTCHSKLLVDNVPTEDSVVAAKFKAQGAVLLGKLATHEFALGGPSFDLPFPPARNPWNPDHIPGGSSSGSGAAVAAGLVRMAMGSDTGGSIRGPAGYCGTIGLKPTYGLVSRRGVFPLSYTLDHCGPLSWTVEDSAIAMEVIAGFDPKDPGSADVPVPDFRSKLGAGVQGLRIGVPRQWFVKTDGVSAETIAAIDDAAQTLAKLGATIEEIELPDFELFNACGRVIMFSEAFAIHEKDFQSRPLDYGLFTYLRMSMGAFTTATDLTQAMRLRRELALAVNAKLKDCDALITASTLGPATAFAEIDPNRPPNLLVQTMPFDVTGNPAMSIPTGFSKSGLPLSMQIVGRAFDEPTVLGIGAAYEAATNLHLRRPSFAVAKAA